MLFELPVKVNSSGKATSLAYISFKSRNLSKDIFSGGATNAYALMVVEPCWVVPFLYRIFPHQLVAMMEQKNK